MEIIGQINKLLQGKKTYIVAIIGAILVGLQMAGVSIPEGAWTLLGLLGLGSLRSAIGKIEPPK